jgi:hypothetical protein
VAVLVCYAAILADFSALGVMHFTCFYSRFLFAVIAFWQGNHLVKIKPSMYLKFTHKNPTNPKAETILSYTPNMKYMTHIAELHWEKVTILVLAVLACVALLTFVYLEYLSTIPVSAQFQCENMSHTNRDICLAIVSGDTRACSNITSSFDSDRELCLQGIAVNTQNESVCEELGGGIYNTGECLETINLYNTVDRRFFLSNLPLLKARYAVDNPKCVDSWYLYYDTYYLDLKVCGNYFTLPQACNYTVSLREYEAVSCFADNYGYYLSFFTDYDVTYDRLRATVEDLLTDWGFSADDINTTNWSWCTVEGQRPERRAVCHPL